MRKFNVVIVDDEDFHVKILRDSLSKYDSIQITGEAETPTTAKKVILAQRPDLLFLDVELPGTTGLELLREMRDQIDWSMQVVFYTSYEKYLLEALRSSAFDYLLKPFDADDLNVVMSRFFEYAQSNRTSLSFRSSLSQLLPGDSTFMVATITGFQILHLEQIGFFTYVNERKQWAVHLSDQSQQFLRRHTNSKDILNHSSSFVAISQNQIINISYLAMIQGKQCKLYPPFDWANDLTISRAYFSALQEKFSFI
ncbi:response regulator transcription factor [uncultured Acetobacteroides sp.]|uniref:LytR/AlgR family response regulator transcription factor n=1 Tax=uncultured Acetobacteroides sp. TaxID=1760811 RepID=UPI0029F46A18|nr:response regulator transcription factor [uncultured Acetobacteroides sp.]